MHEPSDGEQNTDRDREEEKKHAHESEMLFVTKRRKAIFRPCKMTLIQAQPKRK